MDTRPSVSYISCATTSKEKTSNTITIAQFEEGNLLSEIFNDTEIGKKSDDDSTLVPLISEEEMDAM